MSVILLEQHVQRAFSEGDFLRVLRVPTDQGKF